MDRRQLQFRLACRIKIQISEFINKKNCIKTEKNIVFFKVPRFHIENSCS